MPETLDNDNEDAEDCKQAQRMYGSICGCETNQSDRCNICIDGSTLQNPFLKLPEYTDSFGGKFEPNCELMQSYIHSSPSISSTSQDCRQIQIELSERCGCSQRAIDELL